MAQITPQKSSRVSELQTLLKNSKSVAVVDYKGLKVSQATELRRLIRKAGGSLVVTKNTLFKIAAGQPDLKLDGPSAFIFSNTDETSAIKAVVDFAKKNNLPTFKMGLLEGQNLNQAEITFLASLPNKSTLIAKVVGGLQSPLFKLVYNLNWNISQLVRTLDAVRASKSN